MTLSCAQTADNVPTRATTSADGRANARTSPHGLARAGYIEVPRDPDLAYEFLQVQWRTSQHHGVEIRRGR
ncbi:hypothetical protein Acsp02_71390 [Actinoplanes sp. NBRC 103695]|nr:hypothetical protein Acsp02_71390 [Actinoplanes sp. NBRC 103695]